MTIIAEDRSYICEWNTLHIQIKQEIVAKLIQLLLKLQTCCLYRHILFLQNGTRHHYILIFPWCTHTVQSQENVMYPIKNVKTTNKKVIYAECSCPQTYMACIPRMPRHRRPQKNDQTTMQGNDVPKPVP